MSDQSHSLNETERAAASPSRRDALRLSGPVVAAIGVALAGAAGCGDLSRQIAKATGPEPPHWAPLPDDIRATELASRVLNRAAFGPRPGDLARVVGMGAAGWIEEQFATTRAETLRADAEAIRRKLPRAVAKGAQSDTMGSSDVTLPEAEDLDSSEDPGLRWRIAGLDIHEIQNDDPNELYSQDDGQLVRETGQAAVLRAVYSRHQLREVMADFWTNHFNIYALKLEGRSLVPIDTERVLRPHVLGSFEAMLSGSAHSPAMLTYLDNKENKNGVANENYAREILELHTLGVRSGYTQRDIQEVARCFTGWTVGSGFDRARFRYESARHDNGTKYIPFLNLTIAPNGQERDGDLVVRTLARHPATARFLAAKLCRRFLGHAPAEIVARAANAYLNSPGGSDIRALIRPILLDALIAPERCRPIVKRPLDLVASAMRCLAADTDGGDEVLKHLAAMGQPLYQWPMPDGFPEKSSAWTSALLPRWNFAIALATNGIKGTHVDIEAPLKLAGSRSDGDRLDAVIAAVLGLPRSNSAAAKLRDKLAHHVSKRRKMAVTEIQILQEATALALSSPTFQWKV